MFLKIQDEWIYKIMIIFKCQNISIYLIENLTFLNIL